MKFRLVEEQIGNKTYIFRGVSNNDTQSNYSNKFKTDLKSRFYAWEAWNGIYMFGDVQVFELLKEDNILNLYESIPVEDFIEEEGLEDFESKWLYSIYGVKTIREMPEDDYHDLYHARQLVATEYLENNTNYDGVCWYEPWDEPDEQIQIWNNSIVRRLPYREAVKVIKKLAEMNPDLYDSGDGSIWDRKFNLYKKGVSK